MLLNSSHTAGTGRRIVHVDMDAFYAAVEQRDDPALRGRPIAVGSGSPRGVVLTASYDARAFGVRSAMPSLHARRLCPELIFVRPRFDAYKVASRHIREIFARHTDRIEPLSLDEAYLDVTPTDGHGSLSATDTARRIKKLVREELDLTASAGVSFNKMLAKLASDMEKPDGLTVIRPAQAEQILASLPVERFHGVGPVTARRLTEIGITTGGDLRALGHDRLVAMLGRTGRWLWKLACGIDDRPVQPDRPRLSVSVETTFADDIFDPERLADELRGLCSDLSRRLQRADFQGRSVVLKLKYADFSIRTRSLTTAFCPHEEDELLTIARDLLTRSPLDGPVRLLGVGVARHRHEIDDSQLSLPFEEP